MKKGVFKRIVAGVMTIAMLGTNMNVEAAGLLSYLDNGDTRIITEYGPVSGVGRTKITGYEEDTDTGAKYYYNKTTTVTVTGYVKTSHYSTSGRIFLLDYNGKKLWCTAYSNGVKLGEIQVTR